MSRPHLVKDLEGTLEAARTAEVELLAASRSVDTAALQRVAMLQLALIATREAIAAHSARVGWAGSESDIEKEAAADRAREE